MPDVVGELILTAVAATGEAEGFVAAAEASYLGISGITALGTTAILATTIGLQYALNKPNIPKPEDGAQAIKQAIPPRIRGYGSNRLAGFYMLYEAGGPAPATSYDVMAFHSGPISRIAAFFLSDDVVNMSADISHGGLATAIGAFADGRYGSAVQVETRIGAPSQTALVSFTTDPLISGIWNSQFRGDGIAYAGMKCASSANPAEYSRVYPRGKPELSVVCECSPVWDPRDPAQHQNDPTTWRSTANPVIELIDYLTREDGGMGLDYAMTIQPNLAAWMAEADLCDVLVANGSGGSEVRYASHGWFRFDNNPEDVVGGILSTCDGWLAESGDGTLSLTVGFYRAPTDPPLTDKHIFGFSLNYGQADEQMVNQLEISFTDPGSKYVEVQADPWRDEDSIALTGVTRSQQIDLKWVQSVGQVRRLADRAMQRLNPQMTGSFTTTLYGLRYLGKRWVPLQYPFVSGLQDCVVEIQDAEVDLLAGRITWQFIRIETNSIEAYNPLTDEGGIPVVPPEVSAVALIREDGTHYLREDGTTYVRESI